jgi:hypothetical protein
VSDTYAVFDAPPVGRVPEGTTESSLIHVRVDRLLRPTEFSRPESCDSREQLIDRFAAVHDSHGTVVQSSPM